jgi:hypothetical protein
MTAKLFTMLIGIGSKSIYFNLFKDKRSLRRNSYLHSFIAKALAVAIYHYAIEHCHARSVTSSSHCISKMHLGLAMNL